MRNVILFTLLYCGITFSQEKVIDKYITINDNLRVNGEVKEIDLIFHIINRKKDTTTRRVDYNFSKNKNVNRIKYHKTQLIKLIDYDSLSRIKEISFKKKDSTLKHIVQYFSNKTNYPDSILIYSNSDYIERYVNTFKNNLVVKRERFINRTLINYRNYEFNKDNQLIKNTYFNPKNKSKEVFSYQKTKDGLIASYYPVSNTSYNYKSVKDTIIKTTLKHDINRKEVTKSLIKEDSKIQIINIFDENRLKESRVIHSFKDSISNKHMRFNEKNEVKSYYNKYTNSSSITTKWTSYKNDNESQFTIHINTTYDKLNNWIKKVYSRNGIITKVEERKIIYQ